MLWRRPARAHPPIVAGVKWTFAAARISAASASVIQSAGAATVSRRPSLWCSSRPSRPCRPCRCRPGAGRVGLPFGRHRRRRGRRARRIVTAAGAASPSFFDDGRRGASLLLGPAGPLEVDGRSGDGLADRSAAAQWTLRRARGVDAMDHLEPPLAVRALVVVDGHSGDRRAASAAQQAHAAFRAVERSLVGRGEPAVRTDEAAPPGCRHGSLDLGHALGVLAGQDVGEEAGQQLRPDPVGVTASPSTAPSHDGPADHVAGRLVPVRRDAPDDRVVLGVAGGIDLAVEEGAGEGVEGQVDRVDGLQHDQGVPGDRRVDVMRVEPLHRLGRACDGRRRLAELDRQRRDDLDLRLGEAGQHHRQLGEGLGARLHPDALAALPRVVQLQLVVLGDDLLGHRQAGVARRRGRRRCRRLGGTFSLQELEGHVGSPDRTTGSAAMVAGRLGAFADVGPGPIPAQAGRKIAASYGRSASGVPSAKAGAGGSMVSKTGAHRAPAWATTRAVTPVAAKLTTTSAVPPSPSRR